MAKNPPGGRPTGSVAGTERAPGAYASGAPLHSSLTPKSRVIRSGTYPGTVHGGGSGVKGNASARSPTAHPRSRSPKRA